MTETFTEIESASQKFPLMGEQAHRHDLVLMRGVPSIEVVAHDTGVTTGRSLFDLDEDGTVMMFTADLDAERDFLRYGLGLEIVGADDKSGSRECRLKLESRFANWRLNLRLVQDNSAPHDPPLDRAGFSCLAFYSTDLTRDLARLESCGGRDSTDVFDLVLGNRHLSVHMLRSPQGAIFELIKIRGRT